MDWHEIAAAISGILTFVAVVPYVRDMLRGTTRPNVVTWGLWLLVQGIFASAQYTSGASWSIVLPLTEMLTVGFVVFLALIGYGYGKYARLDIVCFLLAIAAIVLWQLTQEPLFALIFSVVADCIAAIPTLVKSYKDPSSETASSYLLVVAGALFALLSSRLWNLPNLLWPAYLFALNGSIFCLVLFGQRLKKQPHIPA